MKIKHFINLIFKIKSFVLFFLLILNNFFDLTILYENNNNESINEKEKEKENENENEKSINITNKDILILVLKGTYVYRQLFYACIASTIATDILGSTDANTVLTIIVIMEVVDQAIISFIEEANDIEINNMKKSEIDNDIKKD
jgi:hypothetical protein